MRPAASLSLRGLWAAALVLSGWLLALPAFTQVRFSSDFEEGVLNNAEFATPSQGWKGAGNFPEITEEHARSGRFAMKAYLNKNSSQTPYRTMLQSAWNTTTDPNNRVSPHAPIF